MDEKDNWFGILSDEYSRPLRWAMKHKPRFVKLEDGSVVTEIHPDDAHLFEADDDEAK